MGTFKTCPEIETGAILYAHWGYSMTLVDFYKVVGRTEKRLYIRPLKKEIVSGDGWQGHVMPTGIEVGEKRTAYHGGGLFRIGREWLRVWDGKPKYFDTLD